MPVLRITGRGAVNEREYTCGYDWALRPVRIGVGLRTAYHRNSFGIGVFAFRWGVGITLGFRSVDVWLGRSDRVDAEWVGPFIEVELDADNREPVVLFWGVSSERMWPIPKEIDHG